MSEDFDNEFLASIAPNVLAVLAKRGFFEKLDDLLCPTDSKVSPERCSGGYKLSEPILVSCGFDEGERSEIFAVLHSVGGCCDCEVLYNLAESSRLKTKYWKARAEDIASDQPRHSS